MTKKDNCLNNEDEVKNCNCEGDSCECEESCDAESNIITLDMEDGSQKDFMVLDIVNHEGAKYVALAEVGAMEYDILRFEEAEEELELSIIEDDDEYNKIAELFTERFNSMQELEEE